jgi:hypothetical protein
LSTLPDLDLVSGYLPPGIHPAAQEEIERRFGGGDISLYVLDPSHRQELFSGYKKFVEVLEFTGLAAQQWIGGSFVTNKRTPSDVDVVSFCDIGNYESLSGPTKLLLKRYFLGKQTAEHCHCDSYFAPVAPDEHPNKAEFDAIRDYWQTTFGRDRAGRPKGIVSCLVDATIEQNDVEETVNATAL